MLPSALATLDSSPKPWARGQKLEGLQHFGSRGVVIGTAVQQEKVGHPSIHSCT